MVDVEESMWSLDEEEGQDGEDCKVLMITLVKPPLTEDEVMWKKGAHYAGLVVGLVTPPASWFQPHILKY